MIDIEYFLINLPMAWIYRHRISILILLLSLIHSCVPDPSIETIDYYDFEFVTESEKKMLAGESIDVTFKAHNNIDPTNNYLKILFLIIKGGGYVSEASVFTDSTGYTTVKWQLGSSSFDQQLKAVAYRPSGEYLTSADFFAYGFRENEWDAISCRPDGYISDMIADTINKITFMISSSKLYRQGNRYYEWERVVDENIVSPRTIEIDDNQVIYISTWNGELVKSTDHGESWIKCTKPYTDNPYYISMTVSNDNYIWVGKNDFPTVFSRDGGIIWQNIGYDLPDFLNGNIFRLKSGAIVIHGTNGTSTYRLNVSYDDGLTWISRKTPGYSTVMYVNENDDIFIGTQENGFTIYQTSDLGETYNKVYSVFPQWGTTMENNIFTRWKDFYYIIIPGYGILKSNDLIHYEVYWRNSDLNDLFIDHIGDLIAKDWNYTTVYYRKTSE